MLLISSSSCWKAKATQLHSPTNSMKHLSQCGSVPWHEWCAVSLHFSHSETWQQEHDTCKQQGNEQIPRPAISALSSRLCRRLPRLCHCPDKIYICFPALFLDTVIETWMAWKQYYSVYTILLSQKCNHNYIRL